jgi:hypothetical protein
MEALTRITFLDGLESEDNITFSSTAAFKGKRPIYSLWDSEEKKNPSGFFGVLMTIDGQTFTSADGRMQIAILTEGEESVHDFQTLDDNEDCSQFYLFFTAQELRDAGYNTHRSPGFNYWNAEAIRWEPRGHVLPNSWDNHRFYNVSVGFVPVCYRLNEDGSVRSQHFGLPVFTQGDIETARSFQIFFGHHLYDREQDFVQAYLFIEFSIDELRTAGVEVPANLAGYRFNPETAVFEEVDKSATSCGWDWITKSFQPICEAEDEDGCKCCSGKLAFPWGSSMSDWILGDQNVFTYMTQGIGEAKQNSKLMRNLFSQNGGPYCDCNCFCDHCNRFHLPWEKSNHRPCEVKSRFNEESYWTCDNL